MTEKESPFTFNVFCELFIQCICAAVASNSTTKDEDEDFRPKFSANQLHCNNIMRLQVCEFTAGNQIKNEKEMLQNIADEWEFQVTVI